MAEVTDEQLSAAEARGHALLASEPRASAAWFDAASGRVVVDLINGWCGRMAQKEDGRARRSSHKAKVLVLFFKKELLPWPLLVLT